MALWMHCEWHHILLLWISSWGCWKRGEIRFTTFPAKWWGSFLSKNTSNIVLSHLLCEVRPSFKNLIKGLHFLSRNIYNMFLCAHTYTNTHAPVHADFAGMWCVQSHRVPCSEGPHASFNTLMLLSWILNNFSFEPVFGKRVPRDTGTWAENG